MKIQHAGIHEAARQGDFLSNGAGILWAFERMD
jgi:hypothetical protein